MIRVTADVVCDGCGAVVSSDRGVQPCINSARANARRRRWRTVRRIDMSADYCPACQAIYMPSKVKRRRETLPEFLDRFGKTPLPRGSDEQAAADVAECSLLEEYTEREAAKIEGED